MPSLKQLTCTIETGDENLTLREYDTSYGDGFVETFVAVPTESHNFAVHLTSTGYIASGLAMFVFIDGVPQCNRNRRGLVMPGPKTQQSQTEVDFRVRQKEEKIGNGKWMGREWSFKQLNTTAVDNATIDTDVANGLGRIEVVVLRCQDEERKATPSFAKNVNFNTNQRNYGLDGNWDDVVQNVKKKPSQVANMHQTSQVHAQQPFHQQFQFTQPLQQQLLPTQASKQFGAVPSAHNNNFAQYQQQQYWPTEDLRFARPYQPFTNYQSRLGARNRYFDEETDIADIDGILAGYDSKHMRRQSMQYPSAKYFQRAAPYTLPLDSGVAARQQQHFDAQDALRNQTVPQLSANGVHIGPSMPATSIPQTVTPELAKRKENFGIGLTAGSYTMDDVKKLHEELMEDKEAEFTTGRLSLLRGISDKLFTLNDLKEIVESLQDDSNEKADEAQDSVDTSKTNTWDNSGNDANTATANWSGPANDSTNNATTTWSNNDNNAAAATWVDDNDKKDDTKDKAVGDSAGQAHWGPSDSTQNANNNNNTAQANWDNTSAPTAAQPASSVAANKNQSRNDTKTQVKSKKSNHHDSGGPHVKSYWEKWNASNQTAGEESLPAIPNDIAQKHNLSHQVQAGKGATYYHGVARPQYLDTMKQPYAVFVFKYRSKDVLERLIGVKVKDPKKDYRKQMLRRSKEEILAELIRAKAEAGYSSSSSLDSMESAKSVKRPSVSNQKAAASTGWETTNTPTSTGWKTTNAVEVAADGNW